MCRLPDWFISIHVPDELQALLTSGTICRLLMGRFRAVFCVKLTSCTGGARDLLDLLLSDACAAISPAACAAARPAAALAAEAAAGTAPADGAGADAADPQPQSSEAAPMDTDAPKAGASDAAAAAGERC